MAITEEQNERLTQILQALEPEIKKLGQASANFVRDQIKRHDQYHEAIFVSPQQWAWLEDLYKKYAGGTKKDHRYGDEPDDEQDTERGESREIDDEIPIVRFEPLSREQWEKIKRAFTAVQAITAGLNFVDYRYGAGVIDEHTKCVWTRQGLRVVLWYSHGTQGATLSKEVDPNRPELPK